MSPASPEFRAIYEIHVDFVWRSLRRLGVRQSDAMDQAQKVFLIAHTKLPEFEGRSRLRTWLFAICQRVASDYRRSAPLRREVATDSAEIDVVGAGPGVDRSEVQQKLRIAEGILQKLPEAQRMVFVLFELEEMSGDEIAEVLGISVGTVRSRLRLARETFTREVKRLSAAASGRRKEAV